MRTTVAAGGRWRSFVLREWAGKLRWWLLTDFSTAARFCRAVEAHRQVNEALARKNEELQWARDSLRDVVDEMMVAELESANVSARNDYLEKKVRRVARAWGWWWGSFVCSLYVCVCVCVCVCGGVFVVGGLRGLCSFFTLHPPPVSAAQVASLSSERVRMAATITRLQEQVR